MKTTANRRSANQTLLFRRPLLKLEIGECWRDVVLEGLCTLVPPTPCYRCPNFEPLHGLIAGEEFDESVSDTP